MRAVELVVAGRRPLQEFEGPVGLVVGALEVGQRADLVLLVAENRHQARIHGLHLVGGRGLSLVTKIDVCQVVLAAGVIWRRRLARLGRAVDVRLAGDVTDRRKDRSTPLRAYGHALSAVSL